MIEQAAPACTGRGPAAALRKLEIARAALDLEIASTKRKCAHPIDKREAEEGATFDTLGCTSGGFTHVYCGICGAFLKGYDR